MLWILNQFLKIALLTGKPYEVPGDHATLRLAVLLSFITHVVAIWGIYTPGAVVGQAILELVMTAAALYIGLSVFGKPERFVQSYAALCGASAILNLAFIPVIYASLGSQTSNAEPSTIISFASFFFLVWSISIVARVVRFSFDTNIPVSILVSLGYLMLARLVYGYVFPF